MESEIAEGMYTGQIPGTPMPICLRVDTRLAFPVTGVV